jgi:dTDP-4-amino-4,6-dideoxygalactose transaminase
MSDLQAAFLLANLEKAEIINTQRCAIWNHYYQELEGLQAHELPLSHNERTQCLKNKIKAILKVARWFLGSLYQSL